MMAIRRWWNRWRWNYHVVKTKRGYYIGVVEVSGVVRNQYGRNPYHETIQVTQGSLSYAMAEQELTELMSSRIFFEDDFRE